MTDSGNRGQISLSQAPSSDVIADNKPPSALIAIRLIECLKRSDTSLCYVAPSENSAEAIAEAIRRLFPEVDLVVLPPWDCLPYDRVAPSRRSMGRRMDALRAWSQPADRPQLLLTSLDAILQRLPPVSVIEDSRLELVAGEAFDRSAFESFVRRTGYVEEALADDPGEFAIRDEVIDIFPAGASSPMRILLSEADTVEELRTYDPKTQRTVALLKSMVFGPASVLIEEACCSSPLQAGFTPIERSMALLYGEMPTVFDLLGGIPVFLAPGAQQRVEQYLDFIDEAHEAHHAFGKSGVQTKRSLYLDGDEWLRTSRNLQILDFDPQDATSLHQSLPGKSDEATPEIVKKWWGKGYTVVISGEGRQADGLCRRLEKATGVSARPMHSWEDIVETTSHDLLRLSASLDAGLIHRPTKTVLLTVGGFAVDSTSAEQPFLGEPQLRVGDVVVHEDHGVGVSLRCQGEAATGREGCPRHRRRPDHGEDAFQPQRCTDGCL